MKIQPIRVENGEEAHLKLISGQWYIKVFRRSDDVLCMDTVKFLGVPYKDTRIKTWAIKSRRPLALVDGFDFLNDMGVLGDWQSGRFLVQFTNEVFAHLKEMIADQNQTEFDLICAQ
jgi:hypothetical protein